MSTAAGAALSNTGLTVLSEEEDLFRASVREFAEGEVRPKVEAMEHVYLYQEVSINLSNPLAIVVS